MAGSGYYSGTDPMLQPVLPSAQGAPINTMSGVQAPQNPAAPIAAAKNQAYKPGSFQQKGAAYLPNQPGTSLYDQLQAAPEWLQKYVEMQNLNSGEVGSYDPALQMRDTYQGLSPEIQQLVQKYSSGAMNNPYFFKNEEARGYFNSGKFDPFNYAGTRMPGPMLGNGLQLSSPFLDKNLGPNSLVNGRSIGNQVARFESIDPFSGKHSVLKSQPSRGRDPSMFNPIYFPGGY